MDLFENEKRALRFPVFFATIDCEGTDSGEEEP
jgi:hypothetical protein